MWEEEEEEEEEDRRGTLWASHLETILGSLQNNMDDSLILVSPTF